MFFLILISSIVAYLLGSVSSSYLLGRTLAGVDIRNHGSGNAGATNTLRILGWRIAVFVLFIDILKGVFAIAFAHLITGGNEVALAFAGFFAIVGHNWPVYFGFRGGKGVATTIGVLLTLYAAPALYAGLIAIALLLLFRYVSVASLTFVALTPIFQWIMHGNAAVILISFAIAVMTFIRHRTNIARLRSGQEHRLFSRTS